MNEGEVKTKSLLKRILSIITIFTMLISLFAPYSKVFATGEDNVKLKIVSSATTLTQDDTINVSIQLESVPNAINVLSFDLNYDDSVLEVVYDDDDGEYLVAGKNSWTSSYVPGNPDSIMLTRGETFEQPNKNIVVITFKVLESVDSTQINVIGTEASGGAGNILGVDDATLTIGESAITHTVTYDYATNGGTTSTSSATPVDVAENSAIDLTPTATKDGYTFIGWNTDSSATTGLSSLNMETTDVTLYAIYSKELTATFHYYDGNAAAQTVTPAITGTMYNGDTSAEITTPTLTENYVDANGKTWTKKGWTTENVSNPTTIITEGTTQNITTNTNYYMVYERDLDIEYNTNGGTPITATLTGMSAIVNSNDITDIYGTSLLPATITSETTSKQGYTFQNKWNTESDGTGTNYEPGITVTFTDDTTLYAVFEAKTYTLSYNVNDGTGTAETTENYVYEHDGATGVTLPTPTRTGYELKGWATTETATEPEYITQIPNASIVSEADSSNGIKLYAVWGPETVNYKVEHYKENLDGTYTKDSEETKSAEAGSTVTLTSADAKTITGYTFDSSIAGTVLTDTIDGSGNTVLKMYYKLNEYTVTFKNYDGTVLDTQTVKHGQSATYGGTTPTKAADDEYVYTFSRWSIDITNVTSTSDAIAQYTAVGQEYTIEYNGNTNNTSDTAMADTTYTYGQSGVELRENTYTKSGYVFKGWATSATATSEEYADKATISDADLLSKSTNKVLTLYAIWEAEPVNYTVEYYKENLDGTYTKDSEEIKTAPTGSTVTLTSADAKTITGYTFDSSIAGTVLTDTIDGSGNTVLKMYYKLNEYEVKFFNEGTQIGTTQTIKYGQAATAPADPEKTATAQYTYTFAGWDTTFDNVTEDLNVNATYTETVNKYTVTFYDEDQTTVLDTKQVDYGTGATYGGATPTKAQTAQYTYTFDKWVDLSGNEVDLSNITEDIDVYATYTETINQYKVKFYNDDQIEVVNTIDVDYGTGITNAPTATKNANKLPGHVYTFDKWVDENGDDADLSNITENTNVYATYTDELGKYQVTFNSNGGNSVTPTSKEVTYSEPYGDIPTPTRTGYNFAGWYDDQTAGNQVTADTIVTQTKNHVLYAHWDIITYKVDFVGMVNDGSPEGVQQILQTAQIPYGSNIIPAQYGIDVNALKATVVTPKYTYTVNTSTPFREAADLTSPVTSDKTIYVNYNEPTINKYKVTFINEDGTALGDVDTEYGQTADDSTINPQKQSDDVYTYSFDKWVDENNAADDLSNVIADRTVYATYIPVYREYEAKFVDDEGNEISTKSDYHYNDDLIVPGDPSKATTDSHTYRFLGWYDSEDANEEIVDLTSAKVTKNITYIAKFEETIRQYTITFYDKDGTTVLDTQTVDYGTSAAYGNDVADLTYEENGYEYTFDKWTDMSGNEDDLSNVIADRAVYVNFTRNPIEYIITYADANGATNPNPASYTVEDSDITLLPLGQRIGMTFGGWYTDTTYTTPISSIETSRMENITVYAKWDLDKLMYFVKEQASDDNDTLASDRIYDDFDDAKAYVDALFDEGRGTALGIYDMNNDLVYFPELHPKYFVKANENDVGTEYTDFDEAKTYVDDLFDEGNGTTLKIYDEVGKLVYEPKVQAPKAEYYVKVNADDPNTPSNTFDRFSNAKTEADDLFGAGTNVKVYDANGEIVYEPQQDLYLKSQKYKITKETVADTDNIREFVKDDIFIYRVSPNTTLADFKSNCDTNGTITVYKLDGTILGENELVGTGMILKDTLNGKEITLTIGVTGDANGNGRVDTGDLTSLRGDLYENNKLTGIHFKAMDIDENLKITTADLTQIRGVLYEGRSL